VRTRADLGYETQRDACRRCFFTARAQALHTLFDQLDFVNRVDINSVDSGAYRVVELIVRLARAVENDLVGAKADSQCFEEFAAAVDLDVDAGFEHDLEDPHV
jgi:hypothetical protein